MRVDANSIISEYQQSAVSSKKSNETDTPQKAKSETDILTLSIEGKEALKNSEEKSYDLKKVMEIRKKESMQAATKEESAYVRAARKSDPKLDAKLYAEDKAKVMEEVSRIQSILMKALTGQPLTKGEEELVKNDPALAQEVAKKKAQGEQFQI